jgi:hypothetical protein
MYKHINLLIIYCLKETPHRSSDGFIEDQHDARFITLQTMIEEVGREEVLEIWKVVDIRSERKHNVHFVIIVNALSFLCSCLKSISKGIVCHHYFRVIMNSKTAAFHISMIPKRWYKDVYQDRLDFQESIIGVYNNEFADKGILPVQKPITIPKTVPILRKAIHKRTLYGHVWGLARTATLLAVEQDDNEITTLLQDYIKRKSNREVDESSAISTIGESSSSVISAIDERPVINEGSTVTGITSIGEIFNSSHKIQRNEGNINAKLNLQTVKNLNKVTSEGI